MNMEIKDKRLLVHTSQGVLVAYASSDPNNPGIYIDLKINDVEYPVALVEYTEMEGVLEKEGHIITRVWRDILKEGLIHLLLEQLSSIIRIKPARRNGIAKEEITCLVNMFSLILVQVHMQPAIVEKVGEW